MKASLLKEVCVNHDRKQTAYAFEDHSDPYTPTHWEISTSSHLQGKYLNAQKLSLVTIKLSPTGVMQNIRAYFSKYYSTSSFPYQYLNFLRDS